MRLTERMLVDVRPHLRLTGRIVGGARRRTSETSFYGANNGDDSSLFSPYSSHNRSRYNSRTTEELDGSVRVRNPDGTSLRIKERSPGRYQVTDDDGNTYSVRKNAFGNFEMEDDTSYSTIQSRSSRSRTTAAKSNDDVKIEKEADGTILVYPTLKGTSFRDYSKPGVRVETEAYGNRMAYPTLPGTSIRDYFKQGTRLEDE